MDLDRPARLQVDADSIPDDDKPPQTGHTFNIWYLKWAGGDSSVRNTEKLKFRVDIKRDSGRTKADARSPICIFFARGYCYRGKRCPYHHRLPRPEDRRIPTQDCFGRDKSMHYRDDMAGVGLLSRVNRTLFVAGANMNDLVQETMSRQFLEFGAIDKIRVLPAKNCAFVTYRFEAEAQFAKEAMDAQTLDGKDVLSVRWANDDPDPNAQAENLRYLEEAAMKTVRALLDAEEAPRKRQKRSREPEAVAEQLDHSQAEAEHSPEEESFFGPVRLRALRKLQKNTLHRSSWTDKKGYMAGYSSDET